MAYFSTTWENGLSPFLLSRKVKHIVPPPS